MTSFKSVFHDSVMMQVTYSGSVNIAKFAYTLDNRDIRTAQEKTFGADPTRHIDYGYDTVNQLTSAVSTETPPLVNQSWNYDPMGNRTQHVSTPGANPTSTATYTTNGLNQISHITNVADSVTTENAFSYDADGNTTEVSNSSSGTQYTYDDADRLSAVVYKNGAGVNVSKSTYAYDGLSRLRIITKYTWDTPTSAWVQQSQKKMLYDGMQVIQERDGSDNVIANNIWDGNIGGLEARVVYDVNTPTNPPQKYFYHYDGSGNVTAVTDDSQQTVASYAYDAYGNLSNSSGAYASQNPWRFSTKYYDDGSGLYYYGYRFYSPGLGSWINRDPSGEGSGLNVYVFASNTPVNMGDANGLWGVQFGANGRNIGIGDASLEFDSLPEFSQGVDTGTAALGSAFTFGLWHTGHECDLGYDTSYLLGGIARDALISALPSGAFVTAPGKAAFWSGTGESVAEGYASRVLGGKTLEMTLGGKFAVGVDNLLEPYVPWAVRKALIWKPASILYTLNSSGPVTAILENPSAESIWSTVEKPLLSGMRRSIRSVTVIFP